MANLTEAIQWVAGIFKLELDTPAQGGTPTFDGSGNPITGFDNAAAQQLADRTQYLKKSGEDHAALTNPHSATAAATANRVVLRDGSGRAKVAAPAADDDIARKIEVDNAATAGSNHANLTNPHSATATASANRLVLRDPNGRAKVAAPAADDDIARKYEVDAAATAGSNHANLTNPHSATASAIANRLVLRDVNGRVAGDTTGNAATATKLVTARTINGVSFDGTASIVIADSTKEPAFSKNSAFNKNFGNGASTVCQGNDTRLSDARPANGGTSAACSGNAATASNATNFINGHWGTLASNGYYRFPSGLIIQWGRHYYGDAKGTRNTSLPFYVTFPNQVFSVTHANFGSGHAVPTFSSLSNTGCWVEMDEWWSNTQSITVHWIAIGH
jgi:hypothetical protein